MTDQTVAGPQLFNAFWHGPPLSAVHWACLASFIEFGHEVDLYAYEPIDAPKGVSVRDASNVVPPDKLFAFDNPHYRPPDYGPFSDLFRFKLLFDSGGWWIDVDVLCNRPDIPACRYAWANEFHQETGVTAQIGTSQIKFPRGDPIVKQLYDECCALIPAMTRREEIGPALISRILKQHATPPEHFGSTDSFYPIEWIEAFKLWLPECHEEVAAKTCDASFVACWASQVLALGVDLHRLPPTGSYMAEIVHRLAPNRSSSEAVYSSQEIIALVKRWLAKNPAAVSELSSVTSPAAMTLLGV